ncbi:MAG: Unknown protein [uncultured Campylobacterales bacterium]|uniref:GP-PDE domain-containing protein n=1 Tax=uncultured Campylobacterales bacterium TaxID=352960 RepID=A0A6S6TG03_9BACT|nr:MAG: Unknown protein [uncultured Campylobacterales bacterium]
MEYIAHRINKIDELKQVPKEYGVELDLRDYGDRLVLEHDPFISGEDFEEYLKHYEHQTMILNIKSERIEYKVLELLQKYNIQKYFFLDSSFPMIYQLSKNKEKNIALRFSEFEGLDTILNMKNRVKWVWIDCFNSLPIDKKNYKLLKENGFKICLVSPELQGQNKKLEIYKQYLKEEKIIFDAICTKTYNIKKWKS